MSGTPRHDGMASAAIGIVDAKQALVRQSTELSAHLERVLAAINSTTDARYKSLLMMRYVEGMQWEDISHKMSYERTQVFILHGRALLEVRAWMDSH